jgi:O-antigen/teichoic acid export membrane protein
LHGRFAAAFRLNPGMVILAPFLVALLFKPKWAYKPWVAWAAFIFLMLYGILRNLPFWPCNLLMPR